MKKLYTLILFAFLFSGATKAQLSLTQIANEPIVGEVEYRKPFDSTTTLPNTAGAAQVWNFTTLASNTIAVVANTYTTPSSVSGGSNYPTSTVAQTSGGNNTFFKSSANLYEMLGLGSSTLALTFTNSAIIANWPVNYSYSNTDPVAGTLTSSYGSGTFTGTIVTTAPGSGTLQLPNAITLNNCLQVKSRLNINATISTTLFPINATITITSYQYYTSTEKYPALTITNTKLTSAILNNDATTISLNNLLFAGINELNFDNAYSVYPNPASGMFNIALTNVKSENVSVEILNQFGQSIKKENLGNGSNINSSINTSGINSGVYFVRTTMGNRSSVKKLIIE